MARSVKKIKIKMMVSNEPPLRPHARDPEPSAPHA
jgi:hypothetical protein